MLSRAKGQAGVTESKTTMPLGLAHEPHSLSSSAPPLLRGALFTWLLPTYVHGVDLLQQKALWQLKAYSCCTGEVCVPSLSFFLETISPFTVLCGSCRNYSASPSHSSQDCLAASWASDLPVKLGPSWKGIVDNETSNYVFRFGGIISQKPAIIESEWYQTE
jgi:hypothetical protein